MTIKEKKLTKLSNYLSRLSFYNLKMIFKIIIILLAAAMLISLFSSAFFLVKDKGNTERAQNTLRIRVTIAVLIMITVAIGIYTGQLGVNIPFG